MQTFKITIYAHEINIYGDLPKCKADTKVAANA